jgi:hypothetical protein
MKTKLMILGLLAVGMTMGINAYLMVDCKNEGDPCAYRDSETGQTTVDNSGKVCKLQYCATTDKPDNKCFVCKPNTSVSIMAAAARPS